MSSHFPLLISQFGSGYYQFHPIVLPGLIAAAYCSCDITHKKLQVRIFLPRRPSSHDDDLCSSVPHFIGFITHCSHAEKCRLVTPRDRLWCHLVHLMHRFAANQVWGRISESAMLLWRSRGWSPLYGATSIPSHCMRRGCVVRWLMQRTNLLAWHRSLGGGVELDCCGRKRGRPHQIVLYGNHVRARRPVTSWDHRSKDYTGEPHRI